MMQPMLYINIDGGNKKYYYDDHAIYRGILFLRFLLERAKGSTHVLSSLAALSHLFWKSWSSDLDFLRTY
jgi:hypothetical protein